MHFPPIEKHFYKEKHFLVSAGGKVLFVGKEYEDVEAYFENPNTCLHHQNDIKPNIHIDCWRQYPKINYRHVKLLSNKTKYFISLPATFLMSQFGHIWQNYYYRLFKILFYIKDKEEKDSTLLLLGSHLEGNFTPNDPYYKKFTEKLVSEFEIESYFFDDVPTIYEVDNFWANNGDYLYDVKRIREHLTKDAPRPWRKVYATKSLWYGKWQTPPYLKRVANNGIDLEEKDKDFLYSDKGYANIYESLVEQDVLTKRVYNENELEDFLSSYGFECIDPGFQFHKEECIEYVNSHNNAYRKVKCVGGCSIEENIRYFNEVKTLVSISASSLQNMIFMQPNSTILELETKFYQINNFDGYKILMGIGENMYDATGGINPDEFSDLCNNVLKKYGDYHPWHAHLGYDLEMNYKMIKNIDLNGRTLIEKMRQDPKIMEILSL